MATLLSTLLGIWIFTVMTRLFLKGTIFGKVLLSVFKSTLMSIKLFVKICKGTFRVGKKVIVVGYKDTQRFYKFIDSKYRKLDEKVEEKQTAKKVVNGNFDNVVSIDKYKNKSKK